MIDKARLEIYRAIAAKPTPTLGDASSALDALPVLLAEVDELNETVRKLTRWKERAGL